MKPDYFSRSLIAYALWKCRKQERQSRNFDYEHFDRSWNFYSSIGFRLPFLIDQIYNLNPEGIGVFDIGCGTGRAMAELEEFGRGKIRVRGSTLTRMPPVIGHKCLPANQIRICHSGNLRLTPGSQHVITAVGSLDYSPLFPKEIPEILAALTPNGVFFLGEVTNASGLPLSKTDTLYRELAHDHLIVSEPVFLDRAPLPMQATYFTSRNTDKNILNFLTF